MLREDIADMDGTVIRKRLVVIATAGADLHEIGDLRLMGIADDPRHAWNRRDLFGRSLRVTTRDENAGGRVLAMYAADRAPRVFIGGGGDGAGVQHNQIGGGSVGGSQVSASRKLRFERGAIGLRGPASEILDEKSGQISV